jgi:hypothetical protein
MWKALIKVLMMLGKADEDRTNTYKPQYSGRWVNKGTDSNEDWQWVEKVKPLRSYYVNVLNLEDDYIISVGIKALYNAIETVECEDERSIELAIKYLEAYYKCLGNVVKPNQVV